MTHPDVQELPTLLATLRERPDDFPLWEELEALAASAQTPEPVAELYADVLTRSLSHATLKRLRENAVRFCEEWFADDTPHMQTVLLRVFELDPADEGVFDRLSMVLTATGAWERLLYVYEKAVDATDSLERRIQLLDDAVRVAKDVGEDADRAVFFMTRLVRLKPQDMGLRASLERLLSKGERWRELITLWDSGTQGAEAAEAARIKVQIAACWLDKLNNPPAAMDLLSKVLEENPDQAEAVALTERILASEEAAAGTRRDALGLLRACFERTSRPLDVARVLRMGLGYAQGEERERLHRDAADLWLAQGQPGEAFPDLGALLQLRPEDDELARELEKLADTLGEKARLVEVLAGAAEHAVSHKRAGELRLRAATLAHDPGKDVERAIQLCEQVFSNDAEPELALDAGRALDALLEAKNRHAARLSVLERLADLERDRERRREVLGALANLARAQGQSARAIATWLKRLAEDERDREALDGLVTLYEANGDHRALVDVLWRRVALQEGTDAGADLARIAEVYAEGLDDVESALSAWNELHQVSPELVAQLGIGALLDRAAAREAERGARVVAALGDSYRVLFDDVERALAHYMRALQSEPTLETARAGLSGLLSRDEVRARAAEALATAYTAADDIEGLLSLLPHRLFGATEPAQRARLLRQAAQLEEQRMQRLERAFEHFCEALVEEPHVATSDAELFRLAERVDGWSALAEALHRASEKLDPGTKRSAHLWAREGEILEQQLGRPEQALVAYANALKATPDDAALAAAVCRVAARQGELRMACDVVVAQAQRANRAPDDLLTLLESELEAPEVYRELARAADESMRAADLTPPVERTLLNRAAGWLATRCEDYAAAEALLVRARDLDVPDAETLRRLVDVQRRSPGAALYGTLLSLAELSSEDLDSLNEAQQVAREVLEDVALERRTLELLIRRCMSLVLQSGEQVPVAKVQPVLLAAVRRLAELLGAASERQAEVQLLRDVALLPIDPSAAQELAVRAADLAAQELGDPELAAVLYQRALEHAPNSTELIAALAAQYEKLGRLDELLVLQQRELSLSKDLERRLVLRLSAARVMAEIEARGGRLGALRANLREAPGHEASLRALEEVLRERGALAEVYELFASQAAQVEKLGEASRAAQLWWRAACVADTELGQEEQALLAYQKVASLDATDEALEALARIRMARNEPAKAIPWLERRLERMQGEERVTSRIRLARAHELAGNVAKAIACLARGVDEVPDAAELRELLADLYRAQGQADALAALLAESALRATDKAQALACAREAAELFCGKLGQPERALEVLRKAVEVEPGDNGLKLLYADALLAAGNADDAAALLDAMLQAFGRRRSAERAEVHVRLSRVAQARGNTEEALEQLDTASSMDRSNAGVLRLLGESAQAAGQFERAERAFRALLMAVKKPQAGLAEIGVAEVLYQLHCIAKEQGQEDKAAELLENAVQTAVHSEVETSRLRALLTARGDVPLLLRVLDLRLAQVQDPAAEAAVRSDLAEVLESDPARRDDALEERLRALSCAPSQDALHQKALSSAEAAGKVQRYVEALRTLGERARRKEDAELASALSLRAGELLERLGDLRGAEAQLRAVEPSAPGSLQARFALARVVGKRGDAQEERAVLQELLALPDDPAHSESRRAAQYRLAELKLADAGTRDEGMTDLKALLDSAPDAPRASAILQAVCDRDPGDERALKLLEQLARRSDDPLVLLDFLERHAHSEAASPGLVREGAELALRLVQTVRAEALLSRAIELAERGDGLVEVLWAAIALGRLRTQLGDVQGGLDWLERAMQVSDPIEAFNLGLEIADVAVRKAQDPARAARIYESLRERDPGDRRVWAALLSLYQATGQLDRMLEVVRATLEALVDPSERNALRLQTARTLFEAGHEDDGAALLHDVLAEDPDNEEAALYLADLYERRGESEAMADLLGRKLESARERRSPSLIPLSLRMGALLEPTRPERAVEVYREGLSLLPESHELLRATLLMIDPERDASERAELIERYLTSGGEQDERALDYALWLLEYQTQSGDEAAFERSLAIAYKVAPGHAELRTRLEQWYRQRDDYPSLAQLLEQEAGHTEDIDRSLALMVEAADIRLEKLGQPSEAAALLRKAREYAPQNLELLKRAVLASAASGELGPALAEIDQAIDDPKRERTEKVELLLLRAEVAGAAGMHDDAVTALDAAHAEGGAAVLERLVQGLEQARLAANERANAVRERELTMRLVALLQPAGEIDRAIEILLGWVQRAQRDLEAFRALLELLWAAERWAEVVKVAEALLVRDESQALGRIAERLMGAARALGSVELARVGLERALERDPSLGRVVQLLAELYHETDDRRALAELMLRYLPEEPLEKRFEQLRRVGELLLEAGDSEAALQVLTQASELKPDDLPTVLFIADAHIAARRFQQAQDLLDRAMNSYRQRRSPELALLRHRMAKLSAAAGDAQARLEWLAAAIDADMNNGDVASELAVVAQNMGDLDTALKALRAVTMLKSDAPMTRAEAFYRQAVIVAQKGEPRRAVLWAKKAKAENASFPGVDQLLAELGEG